MNAPELVLAGGQVVTPEGVLDRGWVRVAGGTIAEVAKSMSS